jgi:O-antigen ligase
VKKVLIENSISWIGALFILSASMLQEHGNIFKLTFLVLLLSIFTHANHILINKKVINIAFLYFLFALTLMASSYYNEFYSKVGIDIIKSQILNIPIIIVSYLLALNYDDKKALSLVYGVLVIELVYAVLIERQMISGRLEGFSGGILQFGHNALLALFITLEFQFKVCSKSSINKLIRLILLLLVALAIIGNGTRSIFLAATFVVLFSSLEFTKSTMFDLFKYKLKKLLIFRKKNVYLFFFIMLVISLSPSIAAKVISIFQPSQSSSNMSKLMAYWVCVQMFMQSPIFGVGLGSFNEYKNSVEFVNLSSSIFDTVGVPHNMYLGYLGEAGILGFTFYFLVSFYVIYQCFLHRALVQKSVILKVLIWFMLAYQVDSFFHNYYAQNFIIVVQGFTLGLLQKMENTLGSLK